MGGSDQWGNIVTGTELIRRKDQGEAYALTTQLIKKADGTKFGKTESGAVWLDPARTSPYQFYQFWLNTTDVDAKAYIRIFTLFERNVIEAMETEHDAAPHTRVLQKALAKDITLRVHGETGFEKAIKSTEFLFGNTGIEYLSELNDEEVLAIFSGVPNFTVAKSDIEAGVNISDLLAAKTTIFPSKGEAKKMIQGGGVAINKEKVNTPDDVYTAANLINNKYLVVQKGKRNYFLIVVE